ncbi:putative transcription factor interactor and regulator CCHC(Zn) family [Helianthus annuus]|uniref:Transcription factor interactor and regulator CCHC(Zn) family n=1 Tax=Helianthus annuus TaxID=4232 RepID=A0A9K3H6L5_HELAN|nr:protein AIR1 isoform X2 [Helianthus annuus]KAF5767893.1 putative transcription factor interactor and regulator CCHC(Zn) family [Helianthus annuus]KAJ0463331.1 putative transcription factor interactor and regulator CCHC(Zn) family [Helianthus annuus]KAJ0484715.1 putative transcription factor interactor and regulator CCHC(Zn) family [Helianthus annuus]KAJ0655272.1 putative transcription factor interactor and regulator CCHC(Zn) family [Helianthus annuus]KAJ0658967.1 putative transcription fact
MGKSARKKPRLPKSNPKSEQDPTSDPPPIILSSDDEADDDLSLKIVQKAMLRACGNEPSTNPSSSVAEVKKKRKKMKEKEEKIGVHVNVGEDVEAKEDDVAPVDADATMETDPSEKSDNIVLRKLLRGPRYFDPPDNSWGNCYNCGEGGHTAANCTSAKRKKPCFVCGSLEHNVKQCNKGKDCFICKKGGHRAKDCPEKSNFASHSSKVCLKCGDSGHEMFSCKGKYSPDDLKEIQCYVCKCFGHLCCANFAGEGPKEVSCYRCGQLGHSGWECARVHAETTSNGTPSSCYKCGQEGHMARKCTTSAKEKKKGESPSFKKNHSRGKHGSHLGVRSVPNARKRNKTQYGEPSSSQPKPRGSRGGWITEDPGDYNHNNHGWGSPKTPVRYKSNDRFHGSGYKSSNDRYHGGSGYNNTGYHSNQGRYHYDSPVVSNGYQQRFSASRFGNSTNYGKQREYGWDY